MKIGIFNRYWSTMGGGEQNAGSYAAYFSREHEVELIGTEDFDVGRLAKILGKPEIAELPVRVIGSHATAATEVSAEYDLFVSHSYLSEDYSLARRSIYVCMFPQTVGNLMPNKLRLQTILPSVNVDSHLDRVIVNKSSAIKIKSPKDDRITFISHGCAGEIKVFDIDANEREIESVQTFKFPTNHALSIPKGKTLLRFFPLSSDDSKMDLTLDSLRQANGVRISWGGKNEVMPVNKMTFIDSYDLVLSISKYTSDWVTTRWSTDSKIHYPAVGLREWDGTVPKQKVILSVGRFFSEDYGHSKRQLQLVAAFKSLCDRGLAGWKLVLIGGCDTQNRDYALSVKKAAVGLPIDVILNADHETLEEQYEKASIYWHATGLGMDLVSCPEKAEHFGIAPVEAMSAGCIPLLFDNGGTAELIEDGISGFAFQSLSQLVDKTSALINTDAEEIENMRSATFLRAQIFSKERFDVELDQLMVESWGDR